MNYKETLDYLYKSAPLFQQLGSQAYKEGLENTFTLDEYFHHPHREFRAIHVAGTNGKGSCSHTLAALLQEAGYKVGLYTSPHLVDFRERIRVNGMPIHHAYVVDFVERHRAFFEPLHPSFFEITTAMAFRYFADRQVDVAVIEVGLGGRLDCTNILSPELSIITNISLDHVQFLGNTPSQIATEKAGIIKPKVPVVIGEATSETRPVFEAKAKEVGAPIVFAEDHPLIQGAYIDESGCWNYATKQYTLLRGELGGLYQLKNTNTLLTAIEILKQKGFSLSDDDVRSAFLRVCQLTGLQGRWQKLETSPRLYCDTGHNVGGITYIVEQLQRQTYNHLHIVFGMVNDKDITTVLELLPKEACYYFTKANVKRALNEEDLSDLAVQHQLHGTCYPTVKEAVEAAKKNASAQDFIFVGGSSFIVADLLTDCYAFNLD